MLVACGGFQPSPNAKAVTFSQSTSRSQDLLYVADPAANNVYVYDYPDGRRVGTISGLIEPGGECSDAQGDVFVTSGFRYSGQITEYMHGGTVAVQTLTDNDYPIACSVDPTNGNLAVVDDASADIAVFVGGQGYPIRYTDSKVVAFLRCAYDDQGNLFVLAENTAFKFALLELVSGSQNFTTVKTKFKSGYPSSLQWWNASLVVGEAPPYQNHVFFADRFRVENGYAKRIGQTKFEINRNWQFNGSPFCLQGHRLVTAVVAPQAPQARIAIWSYPRSNGVKLRDYMPVQDYGYGQGLIFSTVSVSSGQRSSAAVRN